MCRVFLKKTSVLGVLFLLIGICMTPSIMISAQKIKTENFEYTVELIGSNKQKQIIELTCKEASEFELFIKTFISKMETVETIDETIMIFKGAITKLFNYGFLTDKNTIEDAERLVLRGYQNPKFIDMIKKLSENVQFNDDKNYFCLIGGYSTETVIIGTMPFVLSFIAHNLGFSGKILKSITSLSSFISLFNSLPFINYGGMGVQVDEGESKPAEGTVISVGLNGFKSWKGSFYGNIDLSPIYFKKTYYTSMFGFSGFRVTWKSDDSMNSLYFGCAALVSIDQ